MDFTTKKQNQPNRNKILLANSLFTFTIIPPKQLYSLNIHISSSNLKYWSTSPQYPNTQDKRRNQPHLYLFIETVKKKFILITKTDKRAHFSLPISPAKWSVLSKHVTNSEDYKRLNICCPYIKTLLIL